MTIPDTVRLTGPIEERYDQILTGAALEFLTDLHRTFDERRRDLLRRRADRGADLAAGATLDFLPETAAIRRDDTWRVAPHAPGLVDRRCEITGPTDQKMTINALNSGARVWLADLEDANAPLWTNVVGGQINLRDAVERRIDFTSAEGKAYTLHERTATIVVRPRGWHLPEKHILIDGRPASGGLVDFGLYFFHCATTLLRSGTGPYFYLPKLESHLEARLWNDVFVHAQAVLGIPRGTIRATVLIETIPAAFEMEEILYELREHSAGLNAGRWDYLFSIIKKFRTRADFILPDRNTVTMTAPFMRAYTDLLVRTCHRRGAHAIGGMAAFIPSRDEQVNQAAFEKVHDDKTREAADGFDGSWVAHPAMVDTCTQIFDAVLGDRPHQIDVTRQDVHVTAEQLLAVKAAAATITGSGLRDNVTVGIRYLEAWLRGHGAVGINNLMEDVATAEISRSQVWQWLHHAIRLDDGRTVTPASVEQLIDEQTAAIRATNGRQPGDRLDEARELFTDLVLSEDYTDFLTLPAYERLP